jgi:hypothetical protein
MLNVRLIGDLAGSHIQRAVAEFAARVRDRAGIASPDSLLLGHLFGTA